MYDLKKLLDQALPSVESATKEQLLLHQFLAGLPPAVSRQLRAAGETKELEKTVERARLLMAWEDQEQTAAVTADNSQLRQLEGRIAALTEQVAALTINRGAPVRCFRCNQIGHLQRNCPNRRGARDSRRCFVCGLPGHLARECHQGNGNGASVQGSRRPRN